MTKANHSDPAPILDPVVLARVLVMPGAQELFSAFSRIPPGPLRQSVIDHAEVIAKTYETAPPEMRMPDPLLAAAGHTPSRAPKLEGPRAASRAKAEEADPDLRIVRLRQEGQHPQQIARGLQVARKHVEDVIREARAGGVKFPSLKGGPLTGRPLEEKTWITDYDELSAQGRAAVERAAARLGITPQDYLARKVKAVEMAQKELGYPEIEAAVKVSQKTISLWLSNARAAGIAVPYAARPVMDAQFEEASPADANVVRPTRWFGPWADVNPKGRQMIEAAARKRDMTPEAYLDLQDSIVRQRLQGVGPAEIARRTGQDERFVYDVMTAARHRGAAFPPIAQAATA